MISRDFACFGSMKLWLWYCINYLESFCCDVGLLATQKRMHTFCKQFANTMRDESVFSSKALHERFKFKFPNSNILLHAMMFKDPVHPCIISNPPWIPKNLQRSQVLDASDSVQPAKWVEQFAFCKTVGNLKLTTTQLGQWDGNCWSVFQGSTCEIRSLLVFRAPGVIMHDPTQVFYILSFDILPIKNSNVHLFFKQRHGFWLLVLLGFTIAGRDLALGSGSVEFGGATRFGNRFERQFFFNLTNPVWSFCTVGQPSSKTLNPGWRRAVVPALWGRTCASLCRVLVAVSTTCKGQKNTKHIRNNLNNWQISYIMFFFLLFVHHVVDAQKRDLGLATWCMGSSAIIEFPFARLLEIDPLCFYGNFQISYIVW